MNNIIFVGMPGSGKTLMAKLTAKKTNREFIDIDGIIAFREKKLPSQIIVENGEEYFRNIETKILSQYLKLNNKVISTGGGAILKKENREIIKKSGYVIYIVRPIEELSTKNRPLSKNQNALEEMFKIREPLYNEVSKVKIINDSTIEKCSFEIFKHLKRNKII